MRKFKSETVTVEFSTTEIECLLKEKAGVPVGGNTTDSGPSPSVEFQIRYDEDGKGYVVGAVVRSSVPNATQKELPLPDEFYPSGSLSERNARSLGCTNLLAGTPMVARFQSKRRKARRKG